ncbi:G-type lectin S-receptor-like serine/threonine-protein kinase At2g19130 [Lactuca sativa]|uniref:G-type lectin S-receptor-like serine/threonine-protein kinase At2g19130 n=1 Tax=Lactuca sativa TaxID=4236 RepID=UPI0022B006A0|nr:G-type lectin S-receptor-like serine/threonine-protein kinase At2g19130 [Lactuca sativa]
MGDLLDDGNLVLRYNLSSSSITPIWQSFDHPTHTFLPGGKLGYNKRTNMKQIITSWKSIEDPASGLFSVEIDQTENQYLLLWNRSQVYLASGSWDGKIFSSMPEMRSNNVNNFSHIDNENESYFTFSMYNSTLTSRCIIDVSWQFQLHAYIETTAEWAFFWQTEFPLICNCLTAFEPRSEIDWNLSDFSGGCVRKTDFSCSVREQKPGFVVGYVPLNYLPTYLENESLELDEPACKRSCSDDCSCDVYGVISNKCLLLNSEILNNISSFFVSEDSNSLTIPFNIKVSSSDLANITEKINTKVLVAGSRDMNRDYLDLQFQDNGRNVRNLADPGILSAEDRKGIDVPFIDFNTILSATENFSLSNKLGQGGFGPVYKVL